MRKLNLHKACRRWQLKLCKVQARPVGPPQEPLTIVIDLGEPSLVTQ